jgi:hypothetical protein
MSRSLNEEVTNEIWSVVFLENHYQDFILD